MLNHSRSFSNSKRDLSEPKKAFKNSGFDSKLQINYPKKPQKQDLFNQEIHLKPKTNSGKPELVLNNFRLLTKSFKEDNISTRNYLQRVISDFNS